MGGLAAQQDQRPRLQRGPRQRLSRARSLRHSRRLCGGPRVVFPQSAFPQSAQPAGFDLAYALPGDAKAPADLCQRGWLALADPVAQLKDPSLPRTKAAKRGIQLARISDRQLPSRSARLLIGASLRWAGTLWLL